MKNIVNRYERKWVCKTENHFTLINTLIRSNFFFYNQYPKRKVNSIYFDNRNYTSIIENLDGVSEKRKVRLRWYGENDYLVNPTLEIKSKRGFETKKEIFFIKELDNIKLKNFNNLELIKNIVNQKKKTRNVIFPLLTTNYERDYFISGNGKVRATIDYNLQSIDLKNLSQLDIIKNFSSRCILEIKYPTNFDKYVRNNLKEISLRLSKNSKFINSAVEVPSFLY